MTSESILVDSNAFMDCMKGGRDPIREPLTQFDSADLVTCGVTKVEVLRDIKSLKAKAQLEEYVSVMRFANTHSISRDDVWNLVWKLDRDGKVLPLTDIVLATCVLKEAPWILTSDH